jgi:hypothetical protein
LHGVVSKRNGEDGDCSHIKKGIKLHDLTNEWNLLKVLIVKWLHSARECFTLSMSTWLFNSTEGQKCKNSFSEQTYGGHNIGSQEHSAYLFLWSDWIYNAWD